MSASRWRRNLTTRPRERVNLRIDNIDPQGALALSFLGEAAADVRPLYSGTTEGAATPGNTALGPRDVYVAAKLNDMAVACGSIRELDSTTAEVRRIYGYPDYRRRHVGHTVLLHLMSEARRLGYRRLCLETANKQPGAMELYQRLGFRRVAPFRKYTSDPASVCYELRLDAESR